MYADHTITIESSTKEDAQWTKIFFKEHCYFYMIFQKIGTLSKTNARTPKSGSVEYFFRAAQNNYCL